MGKNKSKNRIQSHEIHIKNIIILAIFIYVVLNLRYFFTAIVTICIGVFEYIRLKKEIPIDIGIVFYLALLFAHIRNTGVGITFLLAAGLLPRLLCCGLGDTTFSIYPVQAFIIYISEYMMHLDIQVTGVILTIACYLLIVLLSILLRIPLLKVLADTGIPFVLNIVYFIAFSRFIMHWLQILVYNG
ncbi:MAG: hypothetical protein KKF44_09290 [Nanoarchaeota archaeon]|nr:hypothetical protein [Nanoarchaeota archaeon]